MSGRADDERTRIAAALRHVRGNAGLSQTKVAEGMGQDQATVSRLETGEVEPYVWQVLAFERACGQPCGSTLRAAELLHDPVSIEDAIRQDVQLTEPWRKMLLALHAEAVAQSAAERAAS